MSDPLAFPMYAVNRHDTDALWLAVQKLLVARGVPVGSLTPVLPQEALAAHWQNPQLILSQTCGGRVFSLHRAGLREHLLPQRAGGA